MNEQHILRRAIEIIPRKVIRHPRLKRAREGELQVKFDIRVEFWLRDEHNPQEAPVWEGYLTFRNATAFLKKDRPGQVFIKHGMQLDAPRRMTKIISELCKENPVIQAALDIGPSSSAVRRLMKSWGMMPEKLSPSAPG